MLQESLGPLSPFDLERSLLTRFTTPRKPLQSPASNARLDSFPATHLSSPNASPVDKDTIYLLSDTDLYNTYFRRAGEEKALSPAVVATPILKKRRLSEQKTPETPTKDGINQHSKLGRSLFSPDSTVPATKRLLLSPTSQVEVERRIHNFNEVVEWIYNFQNGTHRG